MEGIKVFLFALYVAAYTNLWWLAAIYDNEKHIYTIVVILSTLFNVGCVCYWLIKHWNDKEGSD